MQRPTIKREVATTFQDKNTRIIWFYATQDAVTEFNRYGLIRDTNRPDYYYIAVDARFDFDEVLAYIQNYG